MEERQKRGSPWTLIARWWIFSLPFNGALIAGLPGVWGALISVAEDPDPDYPPQPPPAEETASRRWVVRAFATVLYPACLSSHLGLNTFKFERRDGEQWGLVVVGWKRRGGMRIGSVASSSLLPVTHVSLFPPPPLSHPALPSAARLHISKRCNWIK